MDNTPPARYSRKSAVCARFGFTAAQLTRLIAAGQFPKPIYFGPRSPRWRNDELDAFEKRAIAGEIADAGQASALTRAARDSYMQKAATGEIRDKRRRTAARRAEEAA